MGWFGVVRGHPRSLKIAPFDRAHTTSYSCLIETVRLSCTVYEIPSIGPASLYFATPLRLKPQTEGSPGTISVTFLPERDYVTFGSLLSQFRLSSVTLVYPTQGLNLSAKFLHRCVRWPSSDLRAKFYGDHPRGNPPSVALNARGVAKYSDFRPIEGYIS